MKKWIILFLFTWNISGFAQEAFLSADTYTIHYADFHNPSKQDILQQKMQQALQDVGFVVIAGALEGVKNIEKAYKESRLFFMLSEAEKQKISGSHCNYQRGFCSFRTERAKDHFLADQKESFMVGLYPDKACPNLWPQRAELSRLMREIPHQLMGIAKESLSLMANSVELEPSTFSKYFEKENPTTLRLVHYPAFTEATREKIWAAEHTDISFISLIVCPWLDGVDRGLTMRGLEMEDRYGNWIKIHIPVKSVVLRVGDLLQNMTNGYFRSPKFRIKATEQMGNAHRYAMALYCHPKGDTALGPIPSMVKKTGGAVCYPRATRDELLSERLIDINLASDDSLVASLIESGLVERMKKLKIASPRVLKKVNIYKHKLKERASTKS